MLGREPARLAAAATGATRSRQANRTRSMATLETRAHACTFRENQASSGGCISKRGMRAHTGRPCPVVPKNDPVAVLSALMTW